MVETTTELPVINLTPFLHDPQSNEALAECAKAAKAMSEYSCLSVLDPRVTETMNSNFLNLLEDYFEQPDAVKALDARPELSFQVGATPANTELPRCGRDPKCLAVVEALSDEDKPSDLNQKDPKWRFFWRVGSPPAESKFKQLNAPSVEPSGVCCVMYLCNLQI